MTETTKDMGQLTAEEHRATRDSLVLEARRAEGMATIHGIAAKYADTTTTVEHPLEVAIERRYEALPALKSDPAYWLAFGLQIAAQHPSEATEIFEMHRPEDPATVSDFVSGALGRKVESPGIDWKF